VSGDKLHLPAIKYPPLTSEEYEHALGMLDIALIALGCPDGQVMRMREEVLCRIEDRKLVPHFQPPRRLAQDELDRRSRGSSEPAVR